MFARENVTHVKIKLPLCVRNHIAYPFAFGGFPASKCLMIRLVQMFPEITINDLPYVEETDLACDALLTSRTLLSEARNRPTP